MATNGNQVKFAYVPTGVDLPVSPDADTMYLSADDGLYVGSVHVANLGTKGVTITTTTGSNVIASGSVSQDGQATFVEGVAQITKKSTANTNASASYQFTVDGTAKGSDIDIPTITMTKASTADTGYAATYQLFVAGTATGDKINIPKDLVVESGTVETVVTPDVPYPGAQVGDKYIDLVLANASNQHIYIPVNDLVDTYTNGDGLNLSNNTFSVKAGNGINVDSSGVSIKTPASGSGLTVDSNGVSVDTTAIQAKLTAGTNIQINGTTISATDTTYTAGNGIDITNTVVSAKLATGSTLSFDNSGGLQGPTWTVLSAS